MAWFRFTRAYDHRWPSRAMSHFRPDRGVDGNGLYNVRKEVAEAAATANKGTLARKPAKTASHAAERKTSDRVAGGDTPAERDDARPDELEPDGGDRRADELPEHAGS